MFRATELACTTRPKDRSALLRTFKVQLTSLFSSVFLKVQKIFWLYSGNILGGQSIPGPFPEGRGGINNKGLPYGRR